MVMTRVLFFSMMRKYSVPSPSWDKVFTILRLTVVGLVAAAAILLVTPITFGTKPFQLTASILIFLIVFVAAFRYKQSPVLLLVLSAIVGLALYA